MTADGLEFICELLKDSHDLASFDSSNAELDTWLRKSALNSDGRNLTKTYIWVVEGAPAVMAYFTLMPYVIEREALTAKQGRGLPDHISGYILARLALHRNLHGQRLGSQLLANALFRAASAAREVGGRFVVVDAIDGPAVSLYAHHGFVPVASDPMRLILPTKALDQHLS